MLLKLILILVLAGILAGLAAQQHLLERSHVASGIRKKIQIFDGIAVLIFIVRFMPLPLGSTQFVQALALGTLVFLAISTLLLLLFQLRPTGTRTWLLCWLSLSVLLSGGISVAGWRQAHTLAVHDTQLTLSSRFPHDELQFTVISDLHLGTSVNARKKQMENKKIMKDMNRVKVTVIGVIAALAVNFMGVEQFESMDASAKFHPLYEEFYERQESMVGR